MYLPEELQRHIQDFARPLSPHWRKGCYCHRNTNAFSRMIILNAYLVRYKLLFGNTLLEILYGAQSADDLVVG